MICGNCGTPIRRGDRYFTSGRGPEHVTCPPIRPVRAGDAPRDTVPDLNLELRTPPEAS